MNISIKTIQNFYESRGKGEYIYVNDLNSEYRNWFRSDENNLKLISRVDENITSPTFTIIKEYLYGELPPDDTEEW